MVRSLSIIASCLAVAAFSGCATAPQIPPELQYSVPADGTSAATLQGYEEKSVLLDNLTSFVLSVDGKRVMAGRKGWNAPLSIPAGMRELELEFNRGVFVARADVMLNAEADARYEIRFETDVKFPGNNTYVDFWIIDSATGKAVTSITRASVGGGSGGTFIPIFIPAG